MSTNNINKDSFKKFLNRINNQKSLSKTGQPVNSPTTQCGSGVKACHSSGSCGGACGCDEDTECSDCSCEKENAKKPNSETLRDDGCFCRNPRCNTFMPMVEPDDVGDGKALCYNCKNPW